MGKVKRDAQRPDGARLLGQGNLWAGVVFICTDAFQAKPGSDLEATGWKKIDIEALISFKTELYKFEAIVYALRTNGKQGFRHMGT